jgi:hypothetical protein
MYPRAMPKAAYAPPVILDHGSLVALTADFDLNLVGSVAKAVTLAQVSGAQLIPGGGEAPSAGDVRSDGGSGGPVADTTPGGGDAGEVLDEGTAGGGDDAPAGSGAGAGAVLAPEQAGELPFTGYPAAALAALGAAVTGTGVAIRAALRRRA